jgi:2-polyprenyl-6-methoxyphenol hydroxylase-like FAD-dependent oxidoreductase
MARVEGGVIGVKDFTAVHTRTPISWQMPGLRSSLTSPRSASRIVANATRFHCHTKVATRFRSGNILLAGDAAYVCSPAQVHGMNSRLQDAFNLAWKLALVCQGHCSPALLDSHEAERRPVAETITASGDAVEHPRP